MTFADRVRARKDELGMTVDEMSRASGIPVSTLNKLLTGVIAEPKLSAALAIAKALDCPLASLLGGSSQTPLSEEEGRFIRKYRALDTRSREFLDMVVEKELSRETGDALPTVDEAEEERIITLPLYILPVSAGLGALLDDSGYCETVDVRATKVSLGADFALRVSGNSMEPKFEDGDIVLVKRQNTVEIGDLGIFIADGEGYFKRYTGKYLHSFNPAYADILISNFSEFRCCGRVIGQMKRRRVTNA